MEPIRLTMIGATGRLARAIIAECASDGGVELVGAVTHKQHELLGRTVVSVVPESLSKVRFTANIQKALELSDILVECAGSEALEEYLPVYESSGLPCIFTSSGYTMGQTAKISELAKTAPILIAPNLSPGVNYTFKLVETIAKLAAGPIEASIVECHHGKKKDAPSGTALRLRQAIEKQKPQAQVSICSIRGGTVVGDHLVTFMFSGERIEVNHKAESRANMGRGCVLAIKWLIRQNPGLFDMSSVLGLD